MSDADVAVLRFSRRAMATLFEIVLPFDTPDAQPAATAALDLIDAIEDQLTVFREHSEVSRLNATAFERDVEVTGSLFELLRQAAAVTRATGGAFDVATGALSKAWGFHARQGRVPTPLERATALAATGMRHVRLDPTSRSVRFARTGVEINLGGIGKGYALDRTASLLRNDWGIPSGLLHGGSSSVIALEPPAGLARGWPVVVKHPWQADVRLGTLHLHNQALGTSAATFQHFSYNGRTLGHLLDPRTGWPAEGMQQVSVVAPTALEADALSTAFFVMGEERIARFCADRTDIGAVVLPSDRERPLTFNLTARTFSPS